MSETQQIEFLKSELRSSRVNLEEVKTRLVYSRVCHQAEAQYRHVMQRGLDASTHTHLRTSKVYRSMYEEMAREKAALMEDKRLNEELIAAQKDYIALQQVKMQQQQQQQQQHQLPVDRSVQGGPLISQYHDQQHPAYQPPSDNQALIEPGSIHQLGDLDYSIGSSIEPPCDQDIVMATTIANYVTEAPIPFAQTTQYPTSSERHLPQSELDKNDGNKRGQDDDGVKPSKRRKNKA